MRRWRLIRLSWLVVVCTACPARQRADPPPPVDEPKEVARSESSPIVGKGGCVGSPGQYLPCLRRVETCHRPKSLAFTPDGRELWVVCHYDKPAVAIYDVRDWRLVGAVDLGAYGGVEITFSSDGKRAYISQFETAAVFEVESLSRKVLRRLDTDSEASKVVHIGPAGRRLFVANWKGHDVTEFDRTTGALRHRYAVDGIPRGLFATDDALFIAGFAPGRLYQAKFGQPVTVLAAPPDAVMRHLVGDLRRARLYVSDFGEDKIWLFDWKRDELTALADTDEHPNTIALSPDGRLLFVSNRGENNPKSYLDVGPQWGTVLVFDALSGRGLDAVVSGNQTTGLAVSPDGRRLAISDFLDNRVAIYEVPASDVVLASDGGRFGPHKVQARKSGGWGAKTPHNPNFFGPLDSRTADTD